MHRIGSLIAAAPLLWMGWKLLRLWVDPASNPDAESWVRFGIALLLLEFVLLHSGVFLGALSARATTPLRKILIFLGLAAFYGIFVVAFALGTSSRAVLEIYGFVMLGRLVAVLADARAGETSIMRSVGGTLVYLPLIIASATLPWPRFGIRGDLADAARTPGSSGIWVDEPHRAIGAAAIYFVLMGVFELYSGLRRTAPPVARGRRRP